MEFNYPSADIPDLYKNLKRDVDIIRSQIYLQPDYPKEECTFEDEMKPAPYR